eukprot:313125-Rhodomonas_salina.1
MATFRPAAEWSFFSEAESIRSKPASSSSRQRGEERKERQHAKFGGNERCGQGLEEQERPKLVSASICLRIRDAMSGTDITSAATR